MKRLAWFVIFVAFQSVVFAQSKTVVSDRPGFSTGTYTVNPGRFNVELGYQYSFNETNSDKTAHLAPLLNLRVGILDNLELDLLWNGWNIDRVNSSSTPSVADPAMGAKYRIIEDDRYNISVLGLISIPVGTSPSTSNHVDPLLGFLWDYTISGKLSMFGVLQATSFITAGNRRYNTQPAIGISYVYTDRLGIFVEYYSDIPLYSGTTAHTIDSGVTYLLTADIQLDINAEMRLNNPSYNFVGMGFSHCF